MPIVRGIEIKNWPFGHETMRVYIRMTFVIMQLDMIKITGLLHPWLLVEVFKIIPEIGIFVEVAQIAFEVNVINGVEAE